VNPDTEEVRGLIRVTNAGRRSVFISLAGIEIPPPFENLNLVLNDSIAGTKLHEGDRPVGYWINHDALA
jgi:hypothetical protein